MADLVTVTGPVVPGPGNYVAGIHAGLGDEKNRDGSIRDYRDIYIRSTSNPRYGADRYSYKTGSDVARVIESLSEGDEVFVRLSGAPRLLESKAGKPYVGGNLVVEVIED